MSKEEEIKKRILELEKKNEELQDEVDSLWAMMDEMTAADIENWKHLWDDIAKDVAIRALMISKTKVDA